MGKFGLEEGPQEGGPNYGIETEPGSSGTRSLSSLSADRARDSSRRIFPVAQGSRRFRADSRSKIVARGPSFLEDKRHETPDDDDVGFGEPNRSGDGHESSPIDGKTAKDSVEGKISSPIGRPVVVRQRARRINHAELRLDREPRSAIEFHEKS